MNPIQDTDRMVADFERNWDHYRKDMIALQGKAKRFHAHLDTCARCKNEPFNLCPIGAAILTGADSHFITKEAGQ